MTKNITPRRSIATTAVGPTLSVAIERAHGVPTFAATLWLWAALEDARRDTHRIDRPALKIVEGL
jgi:hypothetical protein